MAVPTDNPSMAVFCDFENVALGVRDAKYDKFDIKRVLERLLLKGSIVVKKAYCDWERYKAFKATMHEASFELIEIPHVRQSGKNSADIRLVVDALDLCYTKSHVDTFVIISGDSDFSPLVSKLRENAKQVIGVGVKQSTSDLLIANCDEFIFYDDLVREASREGARDSARDAQRAGGANVPAKRANEPAPAAGKPAAEQDGAEAPRRKEDTREELEARRRKAIDIALETFEALMAERGASGRIWASVLKDAIKRRRPDFNEGYFGFRTFGSLLDEAQARGLLEVGRDEKSNTYVRRLGSTAPPVREPQREPVREVSPQEAPTEVRATESGNTPAPAQAPAPAAAEAPAPRGPRQQPPSRPRDNRDGRDHRDSREPQDSRDRHAARQARAAREAQAVAAAAAAAKAAEPVATPAPAPASAAPVAEVSAPPAAAKPARGGARKSAPQPAPAPAVEAPAVAPLATAEAVPAKKPARKGAGQAAAKAAGKTPAAKAPAAKAARKSARKTAKVADDAAV